MFKRASLQYVVKLFFVIFISIVMSGCNDKITKDTNNSQQKLSLKNDRKQRRLQQSNYSKLHILVADSMAGIFAKLIKEFKKISGFWVITLSEMENVQKNHKTTMELDDVKINTGIPSSKFSERMMMRGI